MKRFFETVIISGIVFVGIGLAVSQILFGSLTSIWTVRPEPDTDAVISEPARNVDDLVLETETGSYNVDFMREVDRQALNDQRLAPTYSGDNAIAAAGAKLSADSGITWGPSYESANPVIAAERMRAELDFMKVIDQRALNGQRLAPTYSDANAIAVPEARLNVAGGIVWGPSYEGANPVVAVERSRAELDFMKVIDQRALNGQRLAPTYSDANAIAVPEARPSVAGGIVWGPSYESVNPGVATERSRAELDFMKVIDQRALNGQRLAPTYSDANAIAVPEARPSVAGGIVWGPSYEEANPVVAAERNRAELDFMKQIDLNALNGTSEGPSYQQ